MNTSMTVNQYESKIKELIEDNIRLSTENLKLKYGLHEDVALSGSENFAQNKEKAKSSNKKTSSNTVVNDRNHGVSVAKMKEMKEKNLPIVIEEYKKGTSIVDIAAKIQMSVPTVRAYLVQLRKEGKIPSTHSHQKMR